jgi:hypothetical protein
VLLLQPLHQQIVDHGHDYKMAFAKPWYTPMVLSAMDVLLLPLENHKVLVKPVPISIGKMLWIVYKIEPQILIKLGT